MKASINWLKEYVDCDWPVEKVAEAYTQAGLEVEETEIFNPPVDKIVVGEIKKADKHPNADKLQVCEVDTGAELLQIICGATNARVGIKVAVACIGAKLGADFEIKQAKLRGVESFGMLCSKEELSLEEKSEGIWELPLEAEIGSSIRSHLGEADAILNFELTSNRADCFSIKGLAQELSAITGSYFNHKEHKKFVDKTGNVKVQVENKSDCPRYSARIIRNIKVKPSPDWLARRLSQHGIRPINNIVDITNYVLLEYGQPMHAFNLDKVQDEEIHVRKAKTGESLLSLDGSKLELSTEDLVIADSAKPLALAGVMGGEESGVQEDCTNILLESAAFNPVTVRRNSRRYKIFSESSTRFEKGTDIENTIQALNYAVELVIDLAGGEISSGVKDVQQVREKANSIPLHFKKLETKLGVKVPLKSINEIFHNLGFDIIYSDNEKIQIKAPSFRKDLKYEWDLIEEVARLYGYDNIPVAIPSISHSDYSVAAFNPKDLHLSLCGLGYDEMVNFSFVEGTILERCGINAETLVKISNPISSDFANLRDSTLLGLLKNLKRRKDQHSSGRNRLYEIGNCFFHQGKNYTQELCLGIIGTAEMLPPHWSHNENQYDFYQLKGDLEALFAMLNRPLDYKEKAYELFSPAASADLHSQGQTVGRIGRLSGKMAKAFDLEKKPVFFAEIYLDTLFQRPPKKIRFEEMSSLPSVYRDLNLITDKGIDLKQLIKSMMQHSKDLKNIEIIDVYRGDKIDEQKQSVVFSLEFSNREQTLSKEVIDPVIDAILNTLAEKFNVHLR